MINIFITSYPYVYERYFKVFDYFKDKACLIFILPRKWRARSGWLTPPVRGDIRILPTRAFFYGSKYPIIRGLLKGWMPATGHLLRARAKKGDILYTAIEPNLLTTLWNSYYAKRHGLRHVFFTWQNVPYRKRLHGLKLHITEWIVRHVIRNSIGVICGNEKAAALMREYAPQNFKILRVPISGVDTNLFQPEALSDIRVRYHLENKIILTFAGVLDERKGLRTLLEAFAQSVIEEPLLHLIMVGTGPLQLYAHSFVRERGLVENVTFINWVANKELPGILAASDIFVHPSEPYGGWEEQFGYAIAEAAACGLPVISTDSGSINEIVQSGISGLLLQPKDAQKLHEAIMRLANDSALCKEFGRAGRQHVVATFSHTVIAQKMEAWFESLK